MAKLVGSGLGIGRSAGRGALEGTRDRIKWTAGYVVAWVEDDEFKQLTNARVIEAIAQHKPDVLISHSLGTLITYNAFAAFGESNPALQSHLPKMNYVTMGSQIGNPFVIGNLTNGRVERLPVKRWTQLFNEDDSVFTSRIRLVAPNFEVIDTRFDSPGVANHGATDYLKHRATVQMLYQRLAREAAGGVTSKAGQAASRSFAKGMSSRTARAPRRRALLIGINDYPPPTPKLDGCVNDTYLLSSVLQECGFQPEDIRLCHDHRATRRAILERMEWLVEDVRPEDELFFAFSGHGAQVANYGPEDVVDHKDETLCPYDFDWSPETCISDDDIFEFYSQLPYETRLVMVFDCCHSGGIHRDGTARVRGLAAPDDIRHRELRWDAATQTWVQRKLRPVMPEFKAKSSIMDSFSGSSRAVKRLGRGSSARLLNAAEYAKAKRKQGIVGPYLPLILEACDEEQLASEYSHGTIGYGAFTWSLAAALRQSDGSMTFEGLIAEVRRRLKNQGYEQVPQIVGPTKVKAARIPWSGAKPRQRKPAKSRKKTQG